MRITGYGTGFGQQEGSRERAAAFRARHSIGQRIKGRILRREANGLYWVQAGGEELLARLEVQAEPGDQLIFIVRALTPEIMLQALSGGMSAGDLPGLVQRFRAAREVFEVQDAALFACLCAIPPEPLVLADAFQQGLTARPEAAQRHAGVQELIEQINSSLGQEQDAVALYQPWLLPRLRRQEILFRRRQDGGSDTSLSAVDASAGAFEARLLADRDSARLSLSADVPDASGALQVELMNVVRSKFGLEPTLHGPSKLRYNKLGGVLGELFGEVPPWSSGGLNTRV